VPTSGRSRRDLRAEGLTRLTAAGVEAATAEVDLLLSRALGDVDRSRLPLIAELSAEQADEFEVMLRRRERREPVQHILGEAHFRHETLAVGPGVFVPRPETELLAGWAVETAAPQPSPVVVDLCTGSGAIARALAHEVPHARVHAVELSGDALAWAARNLEGTGVDLRQGDMADAFTDLDGSVDVVVCNPPYIPLTAWESVAPEARDHDPELALFSGEDGLEAMRLLELTARRLLKPGGRVGAEHADVQGESAPAVFTAAGVWREVRDHQDLAGRARFVTARLAR
jgi:release factor glutamine methyltransferase